MYRKGYSIWYCTYYKACFTNEEAWVPCRNSPVPGLLGALMP